jgi:hypothetical protein
MPGMKNVLFAMAMGLLMSHCSYIQRYLKQEETRDSFDSVNKVIIRSGKEHHASADQKADSLLHDMWTSFDSSATRIRGLFVTVSEVKSKSDTLIAFIDSLKAKLEANATGDADMDVSTKIMVEGPEGRLLKKKLEVYKRDMTMLMEPYPLSGPIPIDMDPPKSLDNKKVRWEKAYFNGVPKVAAITILNWLKSNVMATEVMCIERLSKEK